MSTLLGFPDSGGLHARLVATPSSRPRRWWLRWTAASLLGLAVAAPLLRGAAQEKGAPANEGPGLDGVIFGADDQPLAHAWVSVFSASPRDGQKSTILIKHYPECGRYTRTDAEGRFVFKGLSKERLYRLLVSAPGYRPDYIREADPEFGGAQLKLRRARLTNAPPSRRITARLIDPRGRPVPGARIEVNGYRAGDTSFSSTLTSRAEPLAVTDEVGEFTLHCGTGVDALSVSVEGARLARRRLWLTPGEAHLIRLHPGSTVTGRLLDAGNKPVPGSFLNMETDDQSAAVSMRGFEVATDVNGRFSFTHMPAETKFQLSTPSKEREAINAGLTARMITTGTNGGTLALGDLIVTAAHALRGRVVLNDGGIVPDRTRISLGVRNARTIRSATLDADGWFEFLAVPAGEVSLRLQIPGYRISAKNPSKDWQNEGSIVGRLQADHEQFFIELEPVTKPPTPAPTTNRQPNDQPLRPAPIEP